jgi:hypothetical protein
MLPLPHSPAVQAGLNLDRASAAQQTAPSIPPDQPRDSRPARQSCCLRARGVAHSPTAASRSQSGIQSACQWHQLDLFASPSAPSTAAAASGRAGVGPQARA